MIALGTPATFYSQRGESAISGPSLSSGRDGNTLTCFSKPAPDLLLMRHDVKVW